MAQPGLAVIQDVSENRRSYGEPRNRVSPRRRGLHPAALMRAKRNVSYCAGRAGPPQFSVHFAGITNLSLIFFRNSGYMVSAPPSVASGGMP